MNDDVPPQASSLQPPAPDVAPQARTAYQEAQDEIAKAQGMPERDIRRVQEKAFRQIIASYSPEICDAIASLDQTFRRLWYKIQVQELRKNGDLSEYDLLQKQLEIYQKLQNKALASQSIDASWLPRSIREERRRSYLNFIQAMIKEGKHNQLVSLADKSDPYLQKLLAELEKGKVQGSHQQVQATPPQVEEAVPQPEASPEPPLVVSPEEHNEVKPIEKPVQPYRSATHGQAREDLWEKRFGQRISASRQESLSDASGGRTQRWAKNLGVSVMIEAAQIKPKVESVTDTVPNESVTMVQVQQTLEPVTPDVHAEQLTGQNQAPVESMTTVENEHGDISDEKNESTDTKGRGFLSRLFGR